jgi:hypothetical protein
MVIVASRASRRTGPMFPELAWSPLRVRSAVHLVRGPAGGGLSGKQWDEGDLCAYTDLKKRLARKPKASA